MGVGRHGGYSAYISRCVEQFNYEKLIELVSLLAYCVVRISAAPIIILKLINIYSILLRSIAIRIRLSIVLLLSILYA
jgi:hypothetical protein